MFFHKTFDTTCEAVRIRTGAPIPSGADAVVRIDDTEEIGNEVKIKKEVESGKNIRKRGEDINSGSLIIGKGAVIRPADIGMLAHIGRSFVSVFQRPRVAILIIGDEFVDIDDEPQDGEVRSTHGYFLAAQVLECGGVPVNLGIAKNAPDEIAIKLRYGLNSDVVICSGSVSVGDYDVIKDLLKDMEKEMRFWKVASRYGKPLAFGIVGGKTTFGISGNTSESMIAFEEFVCPAMLKLMGHREDLQVSSVCKIRNDVIFQNIT